MDKRFTWITGHLAPLIGTCGCAKATYLNNLDGTNGATNTGHIFTQDEAQKSSGFQQLQPRTYSFRIFRKRQNNENLTLGA